MCFIKIILNEYKLKLTFINPQNANTTKAVCFNSLRKCFEATLPNGVDPDQASPSGLV